jgi:hypothetical protein
LLWLSEMEIFSHLFCLCLCVSRLITSNKRNSTELLLCICEVPGSNFVPETD